MTCRWQICRATDWGILEAIGTEGFFAKEDQLDPLERLGLLLAVRVRLHLANGNFDEAIKGLQTALALTKHVGEGDSTSFHGVGYVIADVLKQLDTYIEQPGAPNLYWSLAALPRPLFDLSNALRGERLKVANVVPGLEDVLNDPQAGPMTAEQLKKWGRFLEGLRFEPNRTFLDRMHFVEEVKAKHDCAKQALIAAGRPLDKVEAMPHVQVALLHSFLEYDQCYDEIMKWRTAPYWEVAAFTKHAAGRHNKRPSDAPVVELAMFIDTPEHLLFRPAKLERKVALWRTIEALRHYAATHDGQFPANLDAVKDVPIPLDPLTGKSFAYERTGATAMLRALPTQLHPKEGMSYELKIKP